MKKSLEFVRETWPLLFLGIILLVLFFSFVYCIYNSFEKSKVKVVIYCDNNKTFETNLNFWEDDNEISYDDIGDGEYVKKFVYENQVFECFGRRINWGGGLSCRLICNVTKVVVSY